MKMNWIQAVQRLPDKVCRIAFRPTANPTFYTGARSVYVRYGVNQ